MALPTIERLNYLLRADFEAGKLYWKPRTLADFQPTPRQKNALSIWTTRYCGKEALCGPDAHGYKTGHIDRVGVKAHRVIWAMYNGRWPENDIDHINGNRSDNRICNLRHADRAQNLSNQKVPQGAVPFHGVKRCGRRYVATISVDNYPRHIGVFDTAEEAARARDKEALRLRGEFAVLNYP